MAKRWICPTCGAGKNAPSRMRSDDVRRYCLPCSEAGGRLVARTCPALDKERAHKAAKRSDKAKRARASASAARKASKAQNAAKRVVRGVDLDREARAIWAALLKIDGARPHRRTLPRVDIRQGRTSGGWGHAYAAWHKVTMTLSPGRPLAGSVVLLAHELTHLVRPREAHTPAFRRILSELAASLYGVEIQPQRKRYETDREFLKALIANLDDVAKRRGWAILDEEGGQQ